VSETLATAEPELADRRREAQPTGASERARARQPIGWRGVAIGVVLVLTIEAIWFGVHAVQTYRPLSPGSFGSIRRTVDYREGRTETLYSSIQLDGRFGVTILDVDLDAGSPVRTTVDIVEHAERKGVTDGLATSFHHVELHRDDMLGLVFHVEMVPSCVPYVRGGSIQLRTIAVTYRSFGLTHHELIAIREPLTIRFQEDLSASGQPCS